MKGLLWVRYSKTVPKKAVQLVMDKVAPYFKDHGIELIVVPEVFDVMDKEEVRLFLTELQETLDKD